MSTSPKHIKRRYLRSDCLYFAAIFSPSFILFGALLFMIYRIELQSGMEFSETSQRQMIDREAHFISDHIRLVVSDLFYIAGRKDVKNYFESGNEDAANLAEDMRFFAERKGLYDHLRILDDAGKEKLRVDLIEGKGHLIGAGRLQDKRDRTYFRETIPLGEGELYISPFDLNVDSGKIESPFKPMIRFATPLYDNKGIKKGIVILNYLGENITSHLRQSASNESSRVVLLNSESYYLSSPDESEQWGFMLPERKESLFSALHPEAWEKMSKSEKGQFRNPEGLFTFRRISQANSIQGSLPGVKESAGYHWYIVSFLSTGHEKEKLHILMTKLFWFYLFIGFFSACGCLLVMFTRRKNIRAEEELVHKRRLAAMGEMSSRLAHEIRDPLHRLGMVYEILRESPEIKGTNREVVANMGETMEELFTMAMELLDYSRKDSLSTQEFDLRRLMTLISGQFGDKCGKKGIAVQTSFEEGVIIKADKFKIDHMVRNLAENALQAMAEGGTLTLWIKTRGAEIEIGVKDTGPGIPDDILENIFDPFFTTKNDGTGLGMPIVKHFAELHGGRVEIKTRAGEGTAVIIILPRG